MPPVIIPTVNELSTYVLTLRFVDEEGYPVFPHSGTYRIDDLESGTVIKPTANLNPSDSVHQLTIAAEHNAILDPTRKAELRCVTVVVAYGTNRQITAEHRYYVKNLAKLPS